MNKNKIKTLLDEIRHDYGLSIPVNLELLAEKVGAEIKISRELESDNLSGFAFQKAGMKIIGVNGTEGKQRQRFTIAHELGHLFLHKSTSINYDENLMLLRDVHSTLGTDIKEVEANRFAAELLMPQDELVKDLSKYGAIDLIHTGVKTQKIISKLAEKYDVSPSAMSVRLTTLYFS